MTHVQKKEYEINPKTMALVAVQQDNGQVFTEVVEREERFYVHAAPSTIVDDSCRYFASSLDGRMAGTKQLTSYTHKPPIVISEAMGIYFFPIISPKRKECSWVAHKYIRTFNGERDKTTTVHFGQGTSVNFPVSDGMFANQVQRTAHLRVILEDRFRGGPAASERRADRIAETFS
ncbi:competence protein ComK [Halobacillus kuroshimensis]|uniref:Competence protein ComK n=1 Tax=Halobacillus kuroshimensis TaxID=302481 RepID=A0ABS3DQQ8_9BACI|nr:competence protein ComK [Halobacillus kuroshimensis]MBN8233669.1 competence protein ComK [Halobacillus kuroshimensis]